MSRFINPFPQFLKLQNGALQPNSDGYLYFYQNGTSTLASIYTDAALTVPATNPQRLDSNGRMQQNVFMNSDLFRIRLGDNNDATIWDKSDFSIADTTEVESLITQLEELIATASADLFAVNYVPNAGMSVDNLDTAGAPVSLTTAYQDTVSGFASAVLSNVSAGTALQSTTTIAVSGYTLKYNGVSCTSAGQPALRFRISGDDATSLSNRTLTVSLSVKHNVGSAVNYTISTYVANAFNNFAAVTTTGLSSTTSVASGSATTISLTAAFADVSNGLEIIVKAVPNQALTTKDFYWSDVAVYPSSVVLPFNVPIYRLEQYRQIDPSGIFTAAANQTQMEAGSSNTVAATPGNLKWFSMMPKAAFTADSTSITNDVYGNVTFVSYTKDNLANTATIRVSLSGTKNITSGNILVAGGVSIGSGPTVSVVSTTSIDITFYYWDNFNGDSSDTWFTPWVVVWVW